MALQIDYGLQYKEFHQDSDSYYESRVQSELTRLLPFLTANRNVDALDIGCGMGFSMGALHRLGYRSVRGIDIDKSQVEASAKRGLMVDRICSVKDFLDALPAESFGLITLLDVLEHIPVDQQIPTVASIYRSLAPGGRLLVQVPNANNIVSSRWLYNDFTHVTCYTEQSLRPVLISGGFDFVDIPPLGSIVPRPSLRPHRIFSKGTREQFRRWIVRLVWRQVLLAELGESAGNIPLDLNLMAVADKRTLSK